MAFAYTYKKRRPVDPEETGSVVTKPYYVEQPNTKRPRTLDAALGSLSLRSPDPPGDDFCSKSKSAYVDGNVAKMTRSLTASEKVDPTEKGDSQTNVAAELTNANMQQQPYQCRHERVPLKSACEKDTGAVDDNGHVSEDDSHESDSSVSESSIRNAMYQLVFGRRNPPLSNAAIGGGVVGYSAVDSKIEDMIRRSRLESVKKIHT